MSYPIVKVEGIGPSFAEKLKAIGVLNTEQYLERARTPKGRKALAAETGIDESRILRWANLCDLMRVKGIGEEFSELLEAAGVDTVKELGKRNAANLCKALADANEKRKMVRALPAETVVARWIESAKTLDAGLSY